MADLSAGHKPKMKSSDKSRSSSSKKPPVSDTATVGVGKLDLSGGMMTFEVRMLVWEQLEQKLNVVEWEEAKSILGENIIEENQALKEENLALLSIWKDFTHTNNYIEEQCQDVTRGATKSPLPEPPHMRDMLFKQIKFFIDELPTRSKREIVASTTPREKIVYEYVTRGSLPSRPSTSGGSRDKPTDTRPLSARSSGTLTPTPPSPGSPGHDASKVEGGGGENNTDAARNLLRAQERIDLDVIQANATQLKALLAQEHDLLVQDAEFLQFCLEQQTDYNSQLQKYNKEKLDSAIPTLQEMKEFNSKLEQKYLETSHDKEKEKERKLASSPSSSRPRTSLPTDSSASPKKSTRNSLNSSSSSTSPSSSQVRNSLTSSSSSSHSASPSEHGGNHEGVNHQHHVPHPPKEQRTEAQRPRAKLSNVTLSPSAIPISSSSSLSSPSLTLPPVSPTSPPSPLPTINFPTTNASPKRTRLKQTN